MLKAVLSGPVSKPLFNSPAAMKPARIFATLLFIIILPLVPGPAAGAIIEHSFGSPSNSTKGLSELFHVAVAKEPIYLILVEKNRQRLRVLEFDTELRVVADYPSATGENSGIKELSGDSKTPEGIYFITQIFRDDKITIFGDKAFHLDYPNFFDLEAGRNGDGIYIHGTNKKLEPNSTNGCVTLTNGDLDDLETYLNQVVTPVVIVQDLDTITKVKTKLLTRNDYSLVKSLLLTEEIKSANVEYNYLYVVNLGNQAVAVADFIYRPFSRSIMRGASHTYIEYSPEQGWSARKRIWRASPLQIYPEAPVKVAVHPLLGGEVQLAEQTPEEAAAMVAALSPQKIPEQNTAPQAQVAVSGKNSATSQPVISLKSQTDQPAAPDLKTKTPVITAKAPQTLAPMASAASRIEQQQAIKVAAPSQPKDKDQVIAFVKRWREAWISKQIEPYIAFYHDAFRSGDKNLAEWKAHKENLNRTYTFITVNISDIKVDWTTEGATVTFRQEYRSDRYSATGRKTLYLEHSDLGWKIKREVYSRI